MQYYLPSNWEFHIQCGLQKSNFWPLSNWAELKRGLWLLVLFAASLHQTHKTTHDRIKIVFCHELSQRRHFMEDLIRSLSSRFVASIGRFPARTCLLKLDWPALLWANNEFYKRLKIPSFLSLNNIVKQSFVVMAQPQNESPSTSQTRLVWCHVRKAFRVEGLPKTKISEPYSYRL